MKPCSTEEMQPWNSCLRCPSVMSYPNTVIKVDVKLGGRQPGV